MRRDMKWDASLTTVFLYHITNGLIRQWIAEPVEEKVIRGLNLVVPAAYIVTQGNENILIADLDQPLFCALPIYVDRAFYKINVVRVQGTQLRYSHASRKQEFKNSNIPHKYTMGIC